MHFKKHNMALKSGRESLTNMNNRVNNVNSCYAVFTFGYKSTAQHLIFLCILIYTHL